MLSRCSILLRRTLPLVAPSLSTRVRIHSASLARLRYASYSTTPEKIRIYTKTGDKGTSALFTGERRNKDDAVFQVLGSVDELNAALGLVAELHKGDAKEDTSSRVEQIEEIQCALLDIGGHVATPRDASPSIQRVSRTMFDDNHVQQLEAWIDEMEGHLSPLRNFILPGGGMPSAQLHVARAVCRRAERDMVPLVRSGAVDEAVGRYINRLSDYLFVAARYASMRSGKTETMYKAKRKVTHDTSKGGE
eukprot:TRINITY_DN11915_c0_g1_i2.p1 TRINITY_DN11915_c0_g1~~TRINITY_DN11915_c0_g1_i2.p1  ORF type:complete len:249 (-),score=71.04 TRINITY_DN11915_c0_g1_i2:64-810(-)